MKVAVGLVALGDVLLAQGLRLGVLASDGAFVLLDIEGLSQGSDIRSSDPGLAEEQGQVLGPGGGGGGVWSATVVADLRPERLHGAAAAEAEANFQNAIRRSFQRDFISL